MTTVDEASEAIIQALVHRGMDRQEAYALVGKLIVAVSVALAQEDVAER